jgi:hypothetical protein
LVTAHNITTGLNLVNNSLHFNHAVTTTRNGKTMVKEHHHLESTRPGVTPGVCTPPTAPLAIRPTCSCTLKITWRSAFQVKEDGNDESHHVLKMTTLTSVKALLPLPIVSTFTVNQLTTHTSERIKV